jgi:putative ABC transport system ATP-binding protein
MDLLTRLNQQGKTIIMVTHEPDIAAYAGHRLHMMDGLVDRIESGNATTQQDHKKHGVKV